MTIVVAELLAIGFERATQFVVTVTWGSASREGEPLPSRARMCGSVGASYARMTFAFLKPGTVLFFRIEARASACSLGIVTGASAPPTGSVRKLELAAARAVTWPSSNMHCTSSQPSSPTIFHFSYSGTPVAPFRPGRVGVLLHPHFIVVFHNSSLYRASISICPSFPSCT